MGRGMERPGVRWREGLRGKGKGKMLDGGHYEGDARQTYNNDWEVEFSRNRTIIPGTKTLKWLSDLLYQGIPPYLI